MENYSRERIMAEVRQLITSEVYKLKESIFPKKESENIQSGSFLSVKTSGPESKKSKIESQISADSSLFKSSGPNFNYIINICYDGEVRQLA